MARSIDQTNPYHVRAAAIYDAEGMDAVMLYLHLQVRLQHINPAEATHILVWTVPDNVLDAYQESGKEAAE